MWVCIRDSLSAPRGLCPASTYRLGLHSSIPDGPIFSAIADSFRGSRRLADIKLKHYVIRKGKYGYWLPTPTMKKLGFQNVSCGPDGPDAWKIAREWEERYQKARRGLEPTPAGRFNPPGSIGDGFTRFRRTQEWAKKPIRTREDWERSWVST